MTAPEPDETLIRHVHRALHHLYDPVELRLSPLASLLGITRGDVPTTLRKVLLDGIAALKPGPRLPSDSNAWRVYQVLCYRFEEQSSQEEVSAQMAVSPRQVRRLEFTAIRALTSHLAAEYGLSRRPAQPTDQDIEADPTPLDQPADAQELDWLRKSYLHETAEVRQLVESALKTSESILKSAHVEVKDNVPAGLPPIVGQAITLRQALLNLILGAVRSSAPNTRLTISIIAQSQRNQIWIDLIATGTANADDSNLPASEINDLLDVARKLAELSSGSLMLIPPGDEKIFAARLVLSSAEQVRILFVDDNEDSLRLFERYLQGTRFHFTGSRDPHHTLELAEECGAKIIVLDIMLPSIDGWELLGRIRTHPHLGGVPVVISTILPQESLAQSLGAAGFLRKPVSREALLEMLNRILETSATE
jgi:CheY-like chemotaxis protein